MAISIGKRLRPLIGVAVICWMATVAEPQEVKTGAAANSVWPSVIAGETAVTRKLVKTLNEPTRVDFEETPLDEVVDFLNERHGIEIQLDTRALDAIGIGSDTFVTCRATGISLRSALKLMLKSIDPTLTFVVADETIQLTTKENIELIRQTRIYNVDKLLTDHEPAEALADTLRVALQMEHAEDVPVEIVPFRQLLIVNASEEQHQRLAELIAGIFLALNVKTQPQSDAAGPGAVHSEARLPVPPSAQVQEALDNVRELYKDDLSTAVTAEDKARVAKRLCDQVANPSLSPSERFATLKFAFELLDQAEHAESAFDIVDRLAKEFQVDAFTPKLHWLAQVSATVRSASDVELLLDRWSELLRDAAVGDRYDDVRALPEAMVSVSRKSGNVNIVRRAAVLAKEAKQLKELFDASRRAVEALGQDPSDADAHLAIGRYRCFVNRQWSEGLPHLAKGSDPNLAATAAWDLASSSAGDEAIAIADGWWKVAEEHAEIPIVQEAILQRAGQWYVKALPNIGGPLKARVEHRMAEIDQRLAPPRRAARPATRPAAADPFGRDPFGSGSHGSDDPFGNVPRAGDDPFGGGDRQESSDVDPINGGC